MGLLCRKLCPSKFFYFYFGNALKIDQNGSLNCTPVSKMPAYCHCTKGERQHARGGVCTSGRGAVVAEVMDCHKGGVVLIPVKSAKRLPALTEHYELLIRLSGRRAKVMAMSHSPQSRTVFLIVFVKSCSAFYVQNPPWRSLLP